MKLPRWFLNICYMIVGAALTMAAVTFKNGSADPFSMSRLETLAWVLYATLAILVLATSRDQANDGRSVETDAAVALAAALLGLATIAGGFSLYAQSFWVCGVGMMLGIGGFAIATRSRVSAY